MRVAGYHQPDGRVQLGRDIGNVVHQQCFPACDIETQSVSDVLRPLGLQVVITAHDVQLRDCPQLIQNVRMADVAGMDDPLTALQRSKRLGTEQAMGVRDDADFHAVVPCRNELAREKRKNTAGYLIPRVIVNDHREQARS
ncbi:hypothetical protein EMIT0P12_30030 [Pseudomonas sp. IT-P12]